MPDTIDRSKFAEIYAQRPPWDIDGPQAPFRDSAAQLCGRVLDSGCGSGENALFLAARGLAVTGVDFLPVPIDQARAKAAARKLTATFLVKDALTLLTWDERFDAAIDSGLFHVFSDADRDTYVRGLTHVVKPGGRLQLLCFSDRTPGTQGPRRVTRPELEAAFKDRFRIDSLTPARFEVRPEFRVQMFDDRDPEGWFLQATRL